MGTIFLMPATKIRIMIIKENYIHPYTAAKLLRLIDHAIKHVSRKPRTSPKGELSKAPLSKTNNSFFVTSSFERGIKKLRKDCRIKELEIIKDVITTLVNGHDISSKYKEHQTNENIREQRLNNENAFLIYGFIPDANIISVSIRFDEPSIQKHGVDKYVLMRSRALQDNSSFRGERA